MQTHDIRKLMETEPDFELEGRVGAFWAPQSFNTGSMWVGYFTGRSPWEIHRDSDELLHVLEGSVEITVLTDDGTSTVTASSGELFVVPKNLWHRLVSREKVVMCGVTPCPTDHSDAADPRQG